MPYKYMKLKGRIKEKFGTQGAFAKAINLSENSLSLKLTGKTSFSQEDMNQWASVLGINLKDYGTYFFT